MSMMDWAKREIEIACEKENPNRKEGEFDYGCACYENALKAFESLCEDGYSGFGIKMVQAILNRLIDGQPLTPIEDTDDIWNECSCPKDGPKVYQCKRMYSLFKHVYEDGTVKYSSNHYSYCININDSNETYYSGFVARIIEEMFPITMPYMPVEPIRVYCEEFSTNKKTGGLDILGIFYALKTENGELEKIEINRFFRASEGSEEGFFTEISKEEYYERKEKKIDETKL